jgi:hypothetical protein
MRRNRQVANPVEQDDKHEQPQPSGCGSETINKKIIYEN